MRKIFDKIYKTDCSKHGAINFVFKQLQIKDGSLYVGVQCADCGKTGIIPLPSDKSSDEIAKIIHKK
jgi:hypothetical protein